MIHCGKQLHDRIILLRGEVCVHKPSLIPPLLIKVPVPSQESVFACYGLSKLPLSTILIFDIGMVQTV